MKKRNIAVLLVLCLLATWLPVSVFAVEQPAVTGDMRCEVASLNTEIDSNIERGVVPDVEATSYDCTEKETIATTANVDGPVRYTVLLLNTEPGYTMSIDGEVIYEVSTSIDMIKTAAGKFVEKVGKADGNNYVAIVSFSRNVIVESQFTNDINVLNSAIDSMGIDEGRPNINAAYQKANEMLEDVENENAIKNIILFTQSAPGEGEYDETGHYSSDDCAWVNSATNVYTYAYANVAYNTAQTLMEKYNLYTIGLFHNYDAVPEEGKSLVDFIIQFCQDVQNAGYINVENIDDLEFVFGDIAASISTDDLKQLYIDQHIEYYNSEEYKNDIVAGYSNYLDAVLDDALSDWSVKGYNILDAVNEFAALDVELDGADMYELLLAQLLYDEQSQNQIQELYNSNLYDIVSETIKTLIDKLEPDSAEKIKCDELFNKLKKYDFDSRIFQDTYAELMNELADQFTPKKVAESLEKFSFVAGIGIDAVSEAGSTVKDILEYVIYGQAYLNTSDDFRNVLFQLYIQSTQFGPDDFLDRFGDDAVGAWDSLWNCAEFEVAIKNFIIEMETYRLDGAKAVANYAKDAVIDGNESFVEGAVVEIAKECGDTILSYIPVLRWLPVVRDGLAAGQLLIDIITNVDERAYSVDMLKKLYVMAYIMDDTVQVIGENMTEDDFATAARFDKSISIYKSIISIAADYGAKYEEELLIAENEKAEILRSQKKVSWYSTALSTMAVQKLMLEDIHCHSMGLLYNHHTGEITYDSTKLQIFVIACPVDVTVRNNNGELIAWLSNNGFEVQIGYEKYFFVCELENGTGDYMKIAIVPEDYEVLLDGIGTGTMNVYIANYTDGSIEETAGFYDVPVTEDSNGYFVDSADNPQLEDLVVDDDIYVGEVIEPISNPFTDVPSDSFYYAPVLWAVDEGITTGATATTFNPNGQCLRAQVVTFLWRAVGCPEPEAAVNPFEDVTESDFYYKAVLWAVENGITNGLDAAHFGPYENCNRAQVVTFLYRAMGQHEVGTAECPFTDVKAGAWYEQPILWAVENGVTNGMSADTFGVDTVCNRAQVVTFLYRTYTD